MKKTKIALLVISLVVVSTLFSLNNLSMTSARYENLLRGSEPYIPISLIEGSYGDYDDDTEVDDFVVLISFDFSGFTEIRNARDNLRMTVTLPSGSNYIFNIDVWTITYDVKTLAVYGINCATESGWYEVELEGWLRVSSGIYFDINDYMIFDPPISKGSGSPTAFALWV